MFLTWFTVFKRICSFNLPFLLKIYWTVSSEFGTYRLCEQRRFRIACTSEQSRQNLRCSLIQESRGTFRQKVRSMAPLNGWACAVKIYHDGMLEDTNSLDGAQLWTTVTERPRQNWCTTTVHVLSYKLADTYLQCVLSISLSQLVAMMTSDIGALGSNSRYSFLFFAVFFFFVFFWLLFLLNILQKQMNFSK